jgi:hypothetical protein
MLFLYRQVTNSLVDLGKLQANVSTSSIVTSNPGEWYAYFMFYICY